MHSTGKGSLKLKPACVNLPTTTWKLVNNIQNVDWKVHMYISTLHLMNPSPRDFLLCSPCIGQRKGGSKTIEKMQKVPKISSALHLSKRRTKDQKTKLSYSHWLQWWPYLSWSNRISLIKLIWLIQLLHLGTFWVNNTHIWTTINAKRGYFSSITSKIASSILILSAIRHCINFQPFLNHRNTENHDFD